MKPTEYTLKGIAGRHFNDYENDEERTMLYNGIPVKWTAGDQIWDCEKHKPIQDMFWAFGYANNKMYQLGAKYDKFTRKLTDIVVFDDKTNYYFDQETFDLLTK